MVTNEEKLIGRQEIVLGEVGRDISIKRSPV